ncbi:hypothetical protein [Ectobacillus panaciterrae]|uniref:hypothetical protein n=1 Tax=Ectobacillus panaciterrae TaxID=363872 RepID=UPI00048ED658|nr:hypothetical protein [Ectobacillus panaciterrae]
MTVIVRGKGEQHYIAGCVRAILRKDTSRKHMLVVDNGKKLYVTVTEKLMQDCEVLGEDGKEVMYLCIIGKELIEDLYSKAKKEENPREWARDAVEYVLENGKRTASQLYKINIR